MPMSELNLGEGTTRARVPDLRAALQALAAIGAAVETAADEHGAFICAFTATTWARSAPPCSAPASRLTSWSPSGAISSRSSSPCSKVPDEWCAASGATQDCHHQAVVDRPDLHLCAQRWIPLLPAT